MLKVEIREQRERYCCFSSLSIGDVFCLPAPSVVSRNYTFYFIKVSNDGMNCIQWEFDTQTWTGRSISDDQTVVPVHAVLSVGVP